MVRLGHRPQVAHGDGLAAAGIVGDRDHAEGNVPGAGPLDERLELRDVDIALEGMRFAGIVRFVDHQVDGAATAGADVGVGGVEVHVGGDGVPGMDEGRREDVLGGATLVCREEVPEAEDVVDRRLQPRVRASTRVRLVALDERGPLMVRHRARARVGEEVDEDVLGAQRKDVVAGGLHGRPALIRAQQPDGLDHLGAERFNRVAWHGREDDRPRRIRGGCMCAPSAPAAGGTVSTRQPASDTGDPHRPLDAPNGSCFTGHARIAAGGGCPARTGGGAR